MKNFRGLRLLLVFVAWSTFSIGSLNAQEIYEYVLDTATRVVNSPTANYTQIQIAQFKRNALIYMRQKAFEQNDSVDAKFLDTQAYNLSEFLTLFFKELVKNQHLSNSSRRDKIYEFMHVTLDCPMWNDPDHATSQSYLTGEEITPFTMDCDWEKAMQVIQEKLQPKK